MVSWNSNEPLGSPKAENFLTALINYQLLKKGCSMGFVNQFRDHHFAKGTYC
jgi:hypothetical protein